MRDKTRHGWTYEVYRGEDWVAAPFDSLLEGDIFRVRDGSGAKPTGYADHYVATSDAKKETDAWTVDTRDAFPEEDIPGKVQSLDLLVTRREALLDEISKIDRATDRKVRLEERISRIDAELEKVIGRR